MSGRDKTYYKPHRQRRKGILRVQAIQEDQRGEGTNWKELQSENRHERRRLAKGARKYDKLHGEGATERLLEEKGIADDPVVRGLVKRGD